MKYVLVVFLFLIPAMAGATNWYVAVGASGSNNGTNWTNAWNEMNQISWGSISAGDTIWLAGGSYSTPMSISASGSAGNLILVRRVRSTDATPVAASGWNASFDSQVVISPTPASLSYGIGWAYGSSGGNYVTVDGRIDSGIKINVTVSQTPLAGSFGCNGIVVAHAVTNITMEYIEVAGPTTSGSVATFCNDDGAVVLHGTWGAVDYVTLSYMRLHGMMPIRHNLVGHSVIDHGWYYDNSLGLSGNLSCTNNVNAGIHENIVISTGTSGGTVSTFSNNEIWNWQDEGLLIGNSGAETAETWTVYNNLWHDPALGQASRIVDTQYAAHNIYLYNNTIANTGLLLTSGNGGGSFSSSSKSRNNLIYNCTGDWDSLITDNSNDWVNSSPNPFVSSSNFHLVPGAGWVGAGANLTSYGITGLDSDKGGGARPASAAWDIGAYQYTTAGTATHSDVFNGGVRH
jgi:hypothetical protein